MAYNPYHLVPPDDPRAAWCEYCGDPVIEEDEDSEQMIDGTYVHEYCMHGFADGLLFQIKKLREKINDMVGKEFV